MIAVLSFVLSILLAGLLSLVAPRIGWYDVPDVRKSHVGNVPLTGGVAIALAILIALTALVDSFPGNVLGLFYGCCLMLCVGCIDDMKQIQARYRFLAQAAVALLTVYWGGELVQDLGAWITPFPLGLGFLAFPFTIIAVVGVINAVNMSDGLDGLCGGTVLITLFWLLVAASNIEQSAPDVDALTPILVAAFGAVAGFLVLNSRYLTNRPARLFLGDGGSMMLGCLIVWMIVQLSQGYGKAGLEPVSAVWILAIPLADMGACIVRRLREGVTPMTADRRHMHHLMLAKGFTQKQTVAILHLVNFAFGAIGTIAWYNKFAPYVMFWLLIALFVSYTRYSLRFWAAYSEPGAADDRELSPAQSVGNSAIKGAREAG